MRFAHHFGTFFSSSESRTVFPYFSISALLLTTGLTVPDFFLTQNRKKIGKNRFFVPEIDFDIQNRIFFSKFSEKIEKKIKKNFLHRKSIFDPKSIKNHSKKTTTAREIA